MFRHSLVHEHKLDLFGGATCSIFPKAEDLLSDSDHQRALEYIAKGGRKKMERYQSMMDFLFCELHPEFIPSCKRFYAWEGPQLRELISDEQVVEYDKRLVKALEVAYSLYSEERRGSWGWYWEQVEEAIAA